MSSNIHRNRCGVFRTVMMYTAAGDGGVPGAARRTTGSLSLQDGAGQKAASVGETSISYTALAYL